MIDTCEDVLYHFGNLHVTIFLFDLQQNQGQNLTNKIYLSPTLVALTAVRS